jgi:PadR family transcriptional regulator, regulatory protein PadR
VGDLDFYRRVVFVENYSKKINTSYRDVLFLSYLCGMNSDFFANWDTQLKKGLLPFLVLQTLSEKEYYGYELIQVLKSSAGMDVTESTMYPLLIRLMKEGLLEHRWVEQPTGIPRKYYFISAKGRKVLEGMKQNLKNLLSKILNVK